jgi:hypothetical protein
VNSLARGKRLLTELNPDNIGLNYRSCQYCTHIVRVIPCRVVAWCIDANHASLLRRPMRQAGLPGCAARNSCYWGRSGGGGCRYRSAASRELFGGQAMPTQQITVRITLSVPQYHHRRSIPARSAPRHCRERRFQGINLCKASAARCHYIDWPRL